MTRRRAGLLLALGLLAGGLWQLGEAGYIHAKALLAQYLLRSAWAETLATAAAPETRSAAAIHMVEPALTPTRHVRPWPWADTWPVARLRVPRLDEDLIVLAGASGRTLAFGPGLHDGGAAPGAPGHTIITAHRDTHFSFLRFLYPGDEVRLTVADGRELTYRVRGTRIVRVDRARLVTDTDENLLTLVTCYPFDAIDAGTPLRFLVTAVAADSI
ncbi:MAG: class GN sortase [Hyphomicrobiales bacterium]|nr:class GN sortase [Hyphomicrobiales bacterium]MCP5373115.1 class GN sortase [Hyphomicrobiales bacterium]